MNTAKAMAECQRYYDRLHHLVRIHRLEDIERKGGKLNSDVFDLLRSSRLLITQDSVYSYNSVDRSDKEYLAELEAYAEEHGIVCGLSQEFRKYL